MKLICQFSKEKDDLVFTIKENKIKLETYFTKRGSDSNKLRGYKIKTQTIDIL